ncbi:hypothetical protein HPB50_009856 [Hyalomma asiaticum]|uniref:Uncharacterized protein n=1 Tax=Hyalomma asiaticum TaxID=266040 RepID=A0ACB7THJ1_HYAAI|nr:hypothetical protein HPB50_009856 [Hyalomma asiaticum]
MVCKRTCFIRLLLAAGQRGGSAAERALPRPEKRRKRVSRLQSHSAIDKLCEPSSPLLLRSQRRSASSPEAGAPGLQFLGRFGGPGSASARLEASPPSSVSSLADDELGEATGADFASPARRPDSEPGGPESGGAPTSGVRTGKQRDGASKGSARVENPQILPRCNCDELRNADAHLETKDLWEKFHELGTEMIITKTGSSCDDRLRRDSIGADV